MQLVAQTLAQALAARYQNVPEVDPKQVKVRPRFQLLTDAEDFLVCQSQLACMLHCIQCIETGFDDINQVEPENH